MTQTTRDQLLEAAAALFAERGFYGVSIANIADEVGLTKQALLHHFTTKEKLYGEVLQSISRDFERVRNEVMAASSDPADQLLQFLMAKVSKTEHDAIRSRLLMRELLDNKRRADTASVWYLKAFLDDLVAMVRALPVWRDTVDAEVLAAIYQALGAINYYAVSEPTLRGIFGDARYKALDKVYDERLEWLIQRVLIDPSG